MGSSVPENGPAPISIENKPNVINPPPSDIYYIVNFYFCNI